MTESISFTLNEKPVTIKTDGERNLLWVLRSDLGITGPKYGCGEGICGSCTILVDNAPVRSCQMQIKDVNGSAVTTIEGLEKDGLLHPLQKAFIAHDALQCGYCTPGMILTAYGLLSDNPEPTRAEILAAMEDNLCRCGAHKRIVEAIQTAAKEMKGGRSL
ncbi:MAG: (2Fe-2S)-binding protein [Pseudomonadota bacterium]